MKQTNKQTNKPHVQLTAHCVEQYGHFEHTVFTVTDTIAKGFNLQPPKQISVANQISVGFEEC